MYSLLRNILFLLKPEKAHYFTMDAFSTALKIPGVKRLFRVKNNSIEVDGIAYKNKLGLAAGFDKDGRFINQLYALGFGFIEVGTVTPLAQEGNPKPRLFRMKKDQALINRMGFNNGGMIALKQRLESFRTKNPNCDMVVGVNIGKNKLTPNDEAVEDYKKCYSELYSLADFFVVNVSSPNTPNLRELQNKSELKKILDALIEIRKFQEVRKPLYLKIAPDLSFDQLDEIIALQSEIDFEGIVATNTSIDRSLLVNSDKSKIEAIGAGGISGAPMLENANKFVSHIRKSSLMTIIGVGGIDSKSSAQSKFNAGANLVEIYTGFIYKGPALIKQVASIG